MSSHYIYAQCSQCQKVGLVYTGDTDVDGFENRSYDGEFVPAICDDCEGENK